MDQQHQPEQHYAGLDVSLDATSICVLDAKGAVVWRGKCASTPEAIRDALRQHAPALVRAGLADAATAVPDTGAPTSR